jgi:hypothetical protein
MDCGSLLPLFFFEAAISTLANPKQPKVASFRINGLRNPFSVTPFF